MPRTSAGKGDMLFYLKNARFNDNRITQHILQDDQESCPSLNMLGLRLTHSVYPPTTLTALCQQIQELNNVL